MEGFEKLHDIEAQKYRQTSQGFCKCIANISDSCYQISGEKKNQPKKKAQHFPHMTLIQNPHKMAGQIAPYQADQVTYPKNNNQVALMLPKFLIWEELFQPQKHKIKREWFKEQTKRNCQHIGK